MPLTPYQRSLTKDEINALPLRAYPGEIRVVRDEEELGRAMRRLSRQTLLGFDTETRPVFVRGKSNPPSILQLASEDRVYVFQLSKLGFPRELRQLLSDPDVVKTGVAVTDDLKALKKLKPFDEAAFTDLGSLSRDLGLLTNGLRTLAANVLGFRISKGEQCSNWAVDHLTPAQVAYAATDAWVSRELYLRLTELFRAARTAGTLPESLLAVSL